MEKYSKLSSNIEDIQVKNMNNFDFIRQRSTPSYINNSPKPYSFLEIAARCDGEKYELIYPELNIPVEAFNTDPKPSNLAFRLESTIGLYGTGLLDAIPEGKKKILIYIVIKAD